MLSYCVRHYMNFPGWNIEDIREVVTNEVIKKANNTKIVVIGGGGLFLPDTNENAISGWQWPISKELLQQFDVPIIVFSVGYNYFYGQKNTSLFEQSVTALVEKARFVGLRNKGSVRHIREFLPDMLKDKIVYQPCTTTLISKFMNITREYDTKKIVFNIAFDRSERRYINGKRKFILSQIAKSARMIEEIGYEILYVAHCDTDLFFLPYLDQENVVYTYVNLSHSLPDTIVKFYSDKELVIGMRGHAQMIPFGVGCRILTLGTHQKMKWFLEDIEALDWYIDVNANIEELANEVFNKFCFINVNNKQQTDKRLNEAKDALWKISNENLNLIKNIIKKEEKYV